MEDTNSICLLRHLSSCLLAVALIVLAAKYPGRRISSSFAREELIGKFRPGEISAAELLSSSMPRHADASSRG